MTNKFRIALGLVAVLVVLAAPAYAATENERSKSTTWHAFAGDEGAVARDADPAIRP